MDAISCRALGWFCSTPEALKRRAAQKRPLAAAPTRWRCRLTERLQGGVGFNPEADAIAGAQVGDAPTEVAVAAGEGAFLEEPGQPHRFTRSDVPRELYAHPPAVPDNRRRSPQALQLTQLTASPGGKLKRELVLYVTGERRFAAFHRANIYCCRWPAVSFPSASGSASTPSSPTSVAS